jgi:hypothetical protein
LFEPYSPADTYLEQLKGRYLVYQPAKEAAFGSGRRGKRRPVRNVSAKSLLPQVRKASGSVTANPTEKIMQKEICNYLTKHYCNVEAERDHVDIKVQHPKGITLIELKASASALHAIRAALGQILEYAFRHPEWRNTLFELVIVGQGSPTDESSDYINWLRKDYKLPVRYISYQRGGTAFEL